MEDNKLLPKLSQNLLEILNDEEYYDITIEVGNDPYKNDGTLAHIKLSNISPEIFQIILRYIYEIGLKTVDSKIITSQHAELILKWVNRLEITDKLTSSYEFKLLFRASRDGHTPEKFHDICDNKSRTVTIIKVEDSTEILGGYNPIEWGPNVYYRTTKDSFIFSFTNDRIENYILSRVVNEKYAIYNGSLYGPSFGESDFMIWNIFNINYCKKSSYKKSIRKTEKEFNVEECEIFQID
ncbi:carbohydrate-binding module family 13 protein [Rhizophagus irregularis DAOM 181602=DAOM 197198]|nr:carbohydrate-binding module family 13 protein [Rhizophagus irregularis DAOM 181602=DAOM 197198]